MVLNNLNFFSQIKKFNYFEKNANFAVGVSGGVDSTTLAFLLSKWAKINRYNIVALIVDHRLRSNSSIEAKKVSLYFLIFPSDRKQSLKVLNSGELSILWMVIFFSWQTILY